MYGTRKALPSQAGARPILRGSWRSAPAVVVPATCTHKRLYGRCNRSTCPCSHRGPYSEQRDRHRLFPGDTSGKPVQECSITLNGKPRRPTAAGSLRAMRVAVAQRGVAVVVIPGDVALQPLAKPTPNWLLPSPPILTAGRRPATRPCPSS